MRRLGPAAALLVALAATACGDEGPRAPAGDPAPADDSVRMPAETAPAVGDPSPADTAAPPAGDAAPIDTAAWTAGIVDRPAPDAAPQATLASVRVARHDGFDRVVWELDGQPGVHVEYVDEPVRACGSGHPVPLPGDGWLEVRLDGARAHTDAGRPTVAWRRTRPGLPTVIEIARTCDFEGIVTHVLAVRSPERYRVARLADPPRVVVDVRHPSR